MDLASWVSAFRAYFWLSYQLCGCSSFQGQFRLNQLLGHIFGYHTSFLGVAAFRHSFAQTQLSGPLSGHASFLATFGYFKILVALNE